MQTGEDQEVLVCIKMMSYEIGRKVNSADCLLSKADLQSLVDNLTRVIGMFADKEQRGSNHIDPPLRYIEQRMMRAYEEVAWGTPYEFIEAQHRLAGKLGTTQKRRC